MLENANEGTAKSPIISAEALAYRDAETPLTGLLCRDQARPGPCPGLLLVHGGAGLDEHARDQARRYAALGFVVLAADMFGDGVAGDRERVIRTLTGLRDDPGRLVRRGQAGLDALSRFPGTDGRLAAYHPLADTRSFTAVRTFLTEAFAA